MKPEFPQVAIARRMIPGYLALLAAGCATGYKRVQVVETRGTRERVGSPERSLVSYRSLRPQEFPTTQSPFLVCRLEKEVSIKVRFRTAVRQSEILERRSTGLQRAAEHLVQEVPRSDLITGLIVTGLSPLALIVGSLEDSRTERVTKPIDGAVRFEVDIEEGSTTEAAPREHLSSEQLGDAFTDENGLIRFRAAPDTFDKGVVFLHNGSAKKFLVKRFVTLSQTEKEWLPAAKLAYEVYSKGEAIAKVRTLVRRNARTPQFVAVIVTDMALDHAFGWILEQIGTDKQESVQWLVREI